MAMHFYLIQRLRYQTAHFMESHDNDSYAKEHERLEAIVSDSENIWEERTYQIAAGGLGITFTIFNYLSGKGVKFDWQIVLIWSLFTFVLILNYFSHRISANNARKMQVYLQNCRKENKPYIEEELNEKYSKQDIGIKVINRIVSSTLVVTVIYTIVYTCIYLFSL